MLIVQPIPHDMLLHMDDGVSILTIAKRMSLTPTAAFDIDPFEYACRFLTPITTSDGFFRFFAMSIDDIDNIFSDTSLLFALSG